MMKMLPVRGWDCPHSCPRPELRRDWTGTHLEAAPAVFLDVGRHPRWCSQPVAGLVEQKTAEVLLLWKAVSPCFTGRYSVEIVSLAVLEDSNHSNPSLSDGFGSVLFRL